MSLYDKASLVQIPSGTKDGTLYSVLPANGDGDFTHTRASSATRVNKDGLIESVASGVPRLDYPLIDGVVQDCPALLLEPSRTNQHLSSEDFSGYAGANFTVVPNDATSPDGNVSADFIKENSGVNQKYFYKDSSITSGLEYTQSIFIKSNGTRYFQITGSTGFDTGMRVNFDLEVGEITLNVNANDASIIEYPDGWYRVSVTDTATTTTTGRMVYALIGSADAGRLASYSGVTTEGVYAWGAMLEVGDYPTSYIPTTTASVTRSADECNSAGTSAEFNDSEGVLFAEIQGLNDTDTSNRYISLTDGTPTNALMIQYRNNGELRLYNGGFSTPEMIYRDANAHATENIKVAIKYGTTTGSYKVYINGFSETIEGAFVATAMSGLDELKFEYALGGNNFYGNTKQIMTFNEALTDSELEQVTSWTSFSEMAKGQLYTIE
jgi:hypothetical protein